MNPFVIHHGTNISHWLSQSDARGAARRARFTRDDCRRLAGFGLDHLRLPVDEEQLWDEGNRPVEEAWDLLQQALDWMAEDGLRAVVDLHILRCHYFNSGTDSPLFSDPACCERFCQCWREFSARLGARPNGLVAYELLNEAVAANPEDWNRVSRAAYDAVRGLEPDRTIVLGSNHWDSVYEFANLDVPAGDPNMLLTFHYYHPMCLTHYHAHWARGLEEYEGPVQYPGMSVPQDVFDGLPAKIQKGVGSHNRYACREQIEADWMWPLAIAKRTGLPLYCGEFGVHRAAPDAPAIAWYRDMRDLFDTHGIAWANWDFRGAFASVDAQGNLTRAGKALFG